ncbi:hypothetical protein BP00DRAFT_485295 [Aspergillus indologenus CBS 114.80]|uniref:GCN5-related N-acetyltransferase Rv2170-like domain-containing protein n=1 Tax=Aspergillus indologenus CBS 114.80 TaxID=1450541 RepID=A0A2V5IAE2_9EURO|nr:hypothetical protein BP00DRAFT_485295 [Aspergillus indologenus CBS 114.80]
MALSPIPSEHDYQRSSPSMDWSDQSPVASPDCFPANPSSTPLDLLDTWYPQYLRCTQYFLEQGQFSPAVLSLAAFLNIRLPCQRLRRYIRRLVVTGHDSPEVLQAFFGAGWAGGVGCVVQQERQTYLFTAKSSGWAATKAAYDLAPDEQTPFLRPLRAPAEAELRLAESRWKEEEEEADAEEPWLAAYIDLHAGRETQVVIYSSAEATASTTIDIDIDHPPRPRSHTNAPPSPETGADRLSLLHPRHPHPQTIRRQLLALFQHIHTRLLPAYTAHLAATATATATATAKDHQLAPPPPQAFLIGNLHTGLLALLFAVPPHHQNHAGAGLDVERQEWGKAYTSGSAAFVPGIKVHRYDRAPYVKYLFGREVVCSGAAAAPAGFRFHTREGRRGVQPEHFALVRSRTVIPRSDATLAMLPGAAVYVQQQQQHAGTVGAGEEDAEDPVAWAFLGPDGSLATLHVEAAYRGHGLAGRVAREAMRRGMVEDGRWWTGEDDTETSMLVHTNVAMGNGASRRVMEKLGGRVGWTVTWTVVEML